MNKMINIPNDILNNIFNGKITEDVKEFLMDKENYEDIYDYCMLTRDGKLFEGLLNIILGIDCEHNREVSLSDILKYLSLEMSEKLLFDFIPSSLEDYQHQPLLSIEEDREGLLELDDNFDFDIDYESNSYVVCGGGLIAPKLSDYYSILRGVLEENGFGSRSHFWMKCQSLRDECLLEEEEED